ncbi:MAG: hypothetical protein JNL50_08490 [Phycisphaerae bacterium]|nr:hypothetical protein [Phycisphaerae bacterium]
MRRPALIGDLAAAFVLGLATFYGILEIRPAPDLFTGLLIALPGLLFFAALAAGAALIGHAWPTRKGESLHCASCGHAVAAENARLLPYCAECGQPWRHFGGRVRGRLITNHPRLVTGVILLSLAMLGMWARSFAQQQLLAQSPDWLLIRQVAVLSWADMQEPWREISARTLSPQSDRQLLETLLNRRARDGSLPSALAVYLQARASTGAMPRDLTDRWLAELFDARLLAPDSVEAGQRIPIDLLANFAAGWTGVADTPQVLLCGVSIDAREVAQSRWDRAAPTSGFGAGSTFFSHAVRTDKPGAVTIEVRGWFFVGQPDTIIKYDDAGAPILPINVYARPFSFSHTVNVREPPPTPNNGT